MGPCWLVAGDEFLVTWISMQDCVHMAAAERGREGGRERERERERERGVVFLEPNLGSDLSSFLLHFIP